MPPGARALFQNELHAPGPARRSALVSTQSVIALVIGLYAAHRGFKALIAGLSFIHDEDEPRGFFSFNLLALVAADRRLRPAGRHLRRSSSALRVLGADLHLRRCTGVPGSTANGPGPRSA